MTTIEKMQDAQLYGGLPAYRDLSSWMRWMIFVKAVKGLPLTKRERVLFTYHTGRSTYHPPPGGFPEACAIVGVQSGKTSIVSLFLDEGALEGAPGTVAVAIAQDARGSMRTLLKYARQPFETLPMFQAEVSRDTADVLELRRGTSLAAYPCKPSAVRGLMANVVVLDEAAFFVSTDGNPTDHEMMRVARGRTAMTGGKVIVISSPYGQSGLLFDLHRKHYGVDDSPRLVWQGAAHEMNPLLSADYLQRLQQEDPDGFESEVMGRFRAGLSRLFDPEAVSACVDVGVRERVPQRGIQYEAAADPASGSGKDSFTLTIVHREGARIIVDLVRAWRPPFNPGGVIAELSDVVKPYGLRRLRGDKYAPGFVAEHCRAQGLTYEFAEHDQSSTYLELLPLVNAGQVRLLDQPDLLRELRGLERRRGNSGRDRVDHRNGSHDDVAASCAHAIVAASAPAPQPAYMMKYSGF